MSSIFTIQDIQKSKVAHLNSHLTEPVRKKSKYGNNKKEVDGIVFHSEKEANYYKNTLKPLLKAGEIGLLEFQVPFELNEDGKFSYKYFADFTYYDKTGERKVIDVKGFRTREYKKKRRLMLKVHGITIIEK